MRKRERDRDRPTFSMLRDWGSSKHVAYYIYRTKERDEQREIRGKPVLFNAFLFGLASLCGPVNPNLCITRSSCHYSQHYTHTHGAHNRYRRSFTTRSKNGQRSRETFEEQDLCIHFAQLQIKYTLVSLFEDPRIFRKPFELYYIIVFILLSFFWIVNN